MSKALASGWAKEVGDTIPELKRLISSGRWAQANHLINSLDLSGVVPDARERLEELAVSALLFGAHHATGDVHTTSYAKGKKPIPVEIKHALTQLDATVKYALADRLRSALHALVYAAEHDAKHVIYKSENGQTLYVSRPLVNSAALVSWAAEQGLPSILEPSDLHVTVCYSKAKVDWGRFKPNAMQLIAKGGERGMERFGKTIVLTFENERLEARHRKFIQGGASHDHADYRPHVTITYAGDDLDMSRIEPFTGPLVFGPEKFEPLKEDWLEGLKETSLQKYDEDQPRDEQGRWAATGAPSEHDTTPVKKAADLSLADRLNQAVLEGKKLVDVHASLTTSRLISLGFLSETVEQGSTQYEINEVLDDKTCPVCEFMHGKVFDASHEYDKTLSALSVTDAASLKNIAPWPSQSKDALEALQDMDEDELQAAGYGSPPYHPNCRGFLVAIGGSDGVEPGGIDQDALQGVIDAAEASRAAEGGLEGAAALDTHTAHLADLIDNILDDETREEALDALEDGDLNTVKQILRDEGFQV